MVRKDPILDALVNLKIHSNRLKKEASRAEATFNREMAKAKKAMEKSEIQIARIHVHSAVRAKNRRMTLIYEAARVDVLINEVKAAQSTRDTSHTLDKASRALEAASASLNLNKLVAVADGFRSNSEDLKIASATVENVVQSVSQQEDGAEGQNDVDAIMAQLADHAGVELRKDLDADVAPEQDVKQPKGEDAEGAVAEGAVAEGAVAEEADAKEADDKREAKLRERLAALRASAS